MPFNCTAINKGSTCYSQATVRDLDDDEIRYSGDAQVDDGETIYLDIKS